jgi:hypothetical protein
VEHINIVVERLGITNKLANGAVAILFGFPDHSVDAHWLEEHVRLAERLIKTVDLVFLFAVS